MKNYEGKLVMISYADGEKRQGIVTGYDKDIGITIQDFETKKYILCLNGPSSPVDCNPIDEHTHKILFKYITGCISIGKYNMAIENRFIKKLLHYNPNCDHITSEDCPFSQ